MMLLFSVGCGLTTEAAAPNDAITRASNAAVRAAGDPTRPVYHFRPPANWMNDPNGPIFHRGYYHMFYQLNPYGDNWGNMHWGHARSRDLVRWEHLPIALGPSKEAGEDHVFSGCAAINGKGQPMIIYTSIGRGKGADVYAEQWAALGDDDLISWQKHPANPVLSEKLHGHVKVYDWRDPFVFEVGTDRRAVRGASGGHALPFMVCGGNLNHGKGGQAVVNLYQAENAEMTQWKFLGVLFTHPDAAVKNIECPNFFKLGDKWVLVISPHRKVEYFVGSFDAAKHQFTPEQRGVMDYGHYYAPNCLEDPSGRRIMWGWVNGFKAGRGWNGCLTLPRVLTLGADGEPRQEPVPELKKLRGEAFSRAGIYLSDMTNVLSELKGDALEIEAELEPGSARVCGLRLRQSENGQQAVTIAYDGSQLDVGGAKAPFKLAENERTLKLRVFLDKSVLEVYANGRACVTRVISAGEKDLGVGLFANGGSATVRSLNAWRMNAIW